MLDREKLSLKENLDEAIGELQKIRSQLSTLAELAGSPNRSPEEAGALIQSLSFRVRQALAHIRTAKGQAGQ